MVKYNIENGELGSDFIVFLIWKSKFDIVD